MAFIIKWHTRTASSHPIFPAVHVRIWVATEHPIYLLSCLICMRFSRGVSSLTHDSQQRDCFNLLRRSVQELRARYLLTQRRAKEELEHKVSLLSRQKQQQLQELTDVREEREGVEERAGELVEKVEAVRNRHQQLIKR